MEKEIRRSTSPLVEAVFGGAMLGLVVGAFPLWVAGNLVLLLNNPAGLL